MTLDADVARRIQHTLYRIGVTSRDVERHCEECVAFGFAAAMVPGRWVQLTAELLRGTSVRVASAVDFPFGLMTDEGRVRESTALAEAGADELDLAVPIGLLLEGENAAFRTAIATVVEAVAPVPVKAMLELPLLTPPQRDRAVDLAVEAGVAWLKNASSGDLGIATPADIRYLRARAPEHVRIKASGGITTHDRAVELLESGAELLGTSNGPAILGGRTASGDYSTSSTATPATPAASGGSPLPTR